MNNKLRDRIRIMADQDGAEITDPGSTRKEFVASVEKAFGAEGKKLVRQMFRDRELAADWKGIHITRKGSLCCVEKVAEAKKDV